MSIELKIKNKHLSEEARIIRFEERKCLSRFKYNINKHYASGNNDEYKSYSDKNFMDYISLSNHRKGVVRIENRATYLARAFISGVPYNTVEQKRNKDQEHEFLVTVLPRVYSMVTRYGKNLSLAQKTWNREKRSYVPTALLIEQINTWAGVKNPEKTNMRHANTSPTGFIKPVNF